MQELKPRRSVIMRTLSDPFLGIAAVGVHVLVAWTSSSFNFLTTPNCWSLLISCSTGPVIRGAIGPGMRVNGT